MNVLHFESFLAHLKTDPLTEGQTDTLRGIVAGDPQPVQMQLVDRVEAASRIGVSKVLLWRLDKSGELNPIRIGARVLYDPTDIERFVSQRKRRRRRGRTTAPVE